MMYDDLVDHVVGVEAAQAQTETPSALQETVPSPDPVFCIVKSRQKTERDYMDQNRPKLPPTRWIVKDYLAVGTVNMLYATAKAGKTLLAIRLAKCISSGEAFMGRRVVRKGGVIYISAEGDEINKARLEAAGLDGFPVISFAARGLLKGDVDFQALMLRVKQISRQWKDQHNIEARLIVIDTVAAGLGLEDENDNTDVSNKLVQIEHDVCMPLGLSVLLVHHSGKSPDAGSRGASSFNGSCATVAKISINKGGARILEFDFNRNGPAEVVGAFKIEERSMGADEEGDPWGVAVAVEVETPAVARQQDKGPKLSSSAQSVFDAVQKCEHLKSTPLQGGTVSMASARKNFDDLNPIDENNIPAEEAKKENNTRRKNWSNGLKKLKELAIVTETKAENGDVLLNYSPVQGPNTSAAFALALAA